MVLRPTLLLLRILDSDVYFWNGALVGWMMKEPVFGRIFNRRSSRFLPLWPPRGQTTASTRGISRVETVEEQSLFERLGAFEIGGRGR